MPTLRQTWDNSHLFGSSNDPAIDSTVEMLKANIAELAQACAPFAVRLKTVETLLEAEYADLIAEIKPIHHRRVATLETLRNVSTFIYSILSVDAQDASASNWMPTLQQLGAELD